MSAQIAEQLERNIKQELINNGDFDDSTAFLNFLIASKHEIVSFYLPGLLHFLSPASINILE